ncbi:MAG: beta-galactosidase, partial [Kiritimatiellaeota bacterium]|nr:beta-galactosidase [Kiritimatiellota bacterium]
CVAKANGGATVAVTDTRRIAVTATPDAAWPGAAVNFAGGPYDLSRYGSLRLTLRNADTRALTVHLSVKDDKYREGAPGGSLALAPGKEGELTCSLRTMPWALDKPLELVGMNNHPKALASGSGGFDVTKVISLHVFIPQSDLGGKPARYEILRVEADTAATRLTMLSADTFLPFVDAFGQFRHADWPGKIHSEAELQKAKADEAKWLRDTPPVPGLNKWGGWADGPQRNATGHFRTEKVNGKWWLVDPDGRLFFSHGIDCVMAGAETGVQLREGYFEWLPEDGSPLAQFYGTGWWAPHNFYKGKTPFKTFDFAKANMFRKYGGDWYKTATDMAHTRIRAWGLNTIGNWSDMNVSRLRRTPYTATFSVHSQRIEGSEGYWGKFCDPYSDDFRNVLNAELAKQKDTASDPWCIGYFVDNEISWGNGDTSLAEAALASPPAQPCKIAFKDWLAAKYETPEKLNAAWHTAHPTWDALLQATALPDKQLIAADLRAFHTEIAERYFRTIRDAIRANAPHKLYLGCRIAWGAPSVYRASAKYCDVVSVNIYKHEATQDLPDGADDKPMINGEFHFGALDRGMFHTGLVATGSQAERAAAYKRFVESCLRHPRYVGTHWFQWRDQALTGRGDGENYQIGFLTVTDQPYPEIINAAREIARTMYGIRNK